MVRQAMQPVTFDRTTRPDEGVLVTSGEPGKVICAGHVPVLRGDSASGSVSVMVDLAEMPRPLANAVRCKVQAWFVPKAAFPQFTGYDEFMHSYQGEVIKQLGAADRTPPPFFETATVTTAIAGSELYKTLGIHLLEGETINLDLPTAFVSAYNFRLEAASSKLTRRSYPSEDMAEALAFPAAFWPKNHFSEVVADYERALLVGAMDLELTSGELPIRGLFAADPMTSPTTRLMQADGSLTDSAVRSSFALVGQAVTPSEISSIWAEMAGAVMTSSLADIEKSRTTQAYAKLRAAYAGNNANGFVNDDALIAELMQGFSVPDHLFKRPWLLDTRDVVFGMVERHATDAANLDSSVSQGTAQARLSINLPRQETGGEIFFTVEVLPERIYERQSDEALYSTSTSHLPDALRDIQIVEPVDEVLNRRLDVRHTAPNSLYGYEPMNNRWRRNTTRLGGSFYQSDPANPFVEQRAAIWQPAIVDPVYTADHFLAPQPFPKTVFADTTKPAMEIVVQHSITISGITQFGDMLMEASDDFDTVANTE